MSEKTVLQALTEAIDELTWTAPGGRLYNMPTAAGQQHNLALDLIQIVERGGTLMLRPDPPRQKRCCEIDVHHNHRCDPAQRGSHE